MQASQNIHKLPDNLINQIKAGEVVERPLNVIKELVENAIDAAATFIQIEILDGGKQLISITDNGKGIPAQDLLLALERHATSKITAFDDLLKLSTFGFRGEALPSIAAVSRFTIRSRTANESEGLAREVELDCGIPLSDKKVASPVGTTVSVKDLFAGVPARLKFLKSTATEFSYIHDFILAICLANPHIGFRFSHNGREVLRFPENQTLQARFQGVLENEAKDFVSVNYSRGSFKVTGFVGLPHTAKPLPRYFMTFVNNRYVKDRVIRAGVLQAYSGLVLKGLIPPAIVFVTVDPGWIDVNAHPSKTEIRFHDHALVQDLIAIGVQGAVKEATHKSYSELRVPPPVTTLGGTKFSNSLEKAQNILERKEDTALSTAKIATPSVQQTEFWQNKEKKEETFPREKASSPETTAAWQASSREKATVWQKEDISREKAPWEGTPSLEKTASPGEVQKNTTPLFETKVKSALANGKYVGQFANCYLFIEVEKDLWVVDQHAFHERILFEELITSYKKQKIPSQDLLIPIVLPLNEVIVGILEEQQDILKNLGFATEVLDNKQIAIRSYPALLPLEKVTEIFDEIVVRILALAQVPQGEIHPLIVKASHVKEEIANLGIHQQKLDGAEVFHLFFATMACHSAIRAGDPLNEELVRRLLNRANDVDFYAFCPHGRPVIRKFTNRDVSSWFLRT